MYIARVGNQIAGIERWRETNRNVKEFILLIERRPDAQ